MLFKERNHYIWTSLIFFLPLIVLPLKFLILKKHYGSLLLLGRGRSPCSPLYLSRPQTKKITEVKFPHIVQLSSKPNFIILLQKLKEPGANPLKTKQRRQRNNFYHSLNIMKQFIKYRNNDLIVVM